MPTADAQRKAAGGFGMAASTSARRAVGPVRLARICSFRVAVQRPEAMDSPARWITASTPARSSGRSRSYPAPAAMAPGAGWRPSRTTSWPPAVRNAVSADPTNPFAPETATRVGPRSRHRQCAARSAASTAWRKTKVRARRRRTAPPPSRRPTAPRGRAYSMESVCRTAVGPSGSKRWVCAQQANGPRRCTSRNSRPAT